MRGSAVRDCLRVLQHFGIEPKQGSAIDVGGTQEVYLSDNGEFGVKVNPLLQVNPHLVLLDRGFNAEHLGTSTNEEIDFLVPSSIAHLKGNFDLVFSFDTLEHVSNPFLFCKHLVEVARPGGYVYLSTIFSWVYHPSPEDYFRFSPTGLEACFADSGSEVLWSGWESDERGVSILVARPPNSKKPDRSLEVRQTQTPPGQLPPTEAVPPFKQWLKKLLKL